MPGPKGLWMLYPESCLARFEVELSDFLVNNYKSLLDEIKTKKELTEEIDKKLKEALIKFKGKFVVEE